MCKFSSTAVYSLPGSNNCDLLLALGADRVNANGDFHDGLRVGGGDAMITILGVASRSIAFARDPLNSVASTHFEHVQRAPRIMVYRWVACQGDQLATVRSCQANRHISASGCRAGLLSSRCCLSMGSDTRARFLQAHFLGLKHEARNQRA